jgi:hypothetical protein
MTESAASGVSSSRVGMGAILLLPVEAILYG